MALPLSSNFRIVFRGLDGQDKGQDDSGFQSVTGLEIQVPDQPGNLPANIAASMACPLPLVLTRAAKSYSESPLLRWIFSHFNKKNKQVLPEALIELLDEKQQPYMAWSLRTIRPKSWKLSELHAEKTEILIETIELTYEELLPMDLT